MIDESQTLTEIVASLPDRMQYNLVSIRVEFAGASVLARLSIALFGPVDDEARLLVYRTPSARDVPDDSLPPGVTLTAIERWPDVIREVSMSPDITTQIQALQDSGLAGTLVATHTRLAGPDADKARAMGLPEFAWTILTHDERARRRAPRPHPAHWRKRASGSRGRRPASPIRIRAVYPGRCTETGELYKPGTIISPHPKGGWMIVRED